LDSPVIALSCQLCQYDLIREFFNRHSSNTKIAIQIRQFSQNCLIVEILDGGKAYPRNLILGRNLAWYCTRECVGE
jgi:hypothetical protein